MDLLDVNMVDICLLKELTTILGKNRLPQVFSSASEPTALRLGFRLGLEFKVRFYK
jgi:hypothetical protein